MEEAVTIIGSRLFMSPAERRSRVVICKAAMRIAEMAEVHREAPDFHDLLQVYAEREIARAVAQIGGSDE